MRFYLSKNNLPELIKLLEHKLENNQLLSVEVKNNDARSKDQNSRLWGYLYKSIGDFTGYTAMELHTMCGSMFLRDSKLIGDKYYEYTKSTTSLNVEEMGAFMQQIEAYFAQLGWSGE